MLTAIQFLVAELYQLQEVQAIRYQGTGFTLSASITKSVSVTISVNKSKLSKLGIWVDTTLTRYKVVQYMYGSPVRTAYKVTSAPFNYYVRVYYK